MIRSLWRDSKLSCVSPEFLARLEELREKFRETHRGGDPISRIFGFFSNEEGVKQIRNEVWRELEGRLEVGKQILVVKQKEVPFGQVHDPYGSTALELYLAVLNSAPKSGEKNPLVLPCDRYVKRDNENFPYSKIEWELNEGPIEIDILDLFWLGSNLEERQSATTEKFTHEGGLFLYSDEEVKRVFMRDEDFIVYIQGLNMLGCGLPCDLKEEYTKRFSKEAVKIVGHLESLLIKETMVTGEISSIYSASKQGGLVKNGAVMLVDGDGDAFFASYGLKEDLRTLRGKIGGYLREAVELELHKVELKLHGRPGILMDVPEYIRGLCKKYRVGVPK